MFDAIFNIMTAWNQVLMGGGGLLMFLIGAAIIGDFIYVRIKGARVDAIISGIAAEGYKDKRPFSQNRKLKNASDQNLWVGVIVAAVFILVGLGVGFKYVHLSLVGEDGSAKIREIRAVSGSEGGTSDYVTVIFQAGDQEYIAYDSYPISLKKYKRGDDVNILFDKNRPTRFVINDPVHSLFLPAVITSIGLFIMLVLYMNDPRRFGYKGKGYTGADFHGEMYSAIYKYQAPDGESYEVTDGSSASYLSGSMPGQEVKLILKPNDYGDARRPSLIWLVLGLIFAVPGAIMLYSAFITMDINRYTFLILIPLLIYAGIKMYRNGKSVKDWEKFKAEQRKKMKKKRPRKIKGHILTEDQIRMRLAAYKRTSFIGHGILLVFGVGLIAGGVYWKATNDEFLATAVMTSGHVTAVNSRYNSSSESYSHYATVGFEAQNGEFYEFQDNVGHSFPKYKGGEKMVVLYQPDNPEYAKVARGKTEDLILLAVLLAGLMACYAAVKSSINMRRAARRYNII